jgi:hypothetical protein
MIMDDVIALPTTIERPFYKAEFKYEPSAGTKGIKGTNNEIIDNKTIEERLTGNIMEVGEPDYWSLREYCERKGIELPVEMEMLCDKFDFRLIISAFSFTPAHGNKFKWGRIVGKMDPISTGKEPIAYDAYPRDIYQEIQEKQQMSIGLDLKFGPITPGVKYVREISFTRLVPQITVAGIGKSSPTWDFQDNAAFNLKGVNALCIIAKTPLASDGIKISFPSYAQIKTYWGQVPIPTTAKFLEGNDTYEIIF